MLRKDQLKEMCMPPDIGKAYYRPFTCRGKIAEDGIFFVGINPATPIMPDDIGLSEYVELITDYDAFVTYYKKCRLQNGKAEISRTRIGMNVFLDELSCYTTAPIFETDVVPYPTASLKLLKKEPAFVVERGKEIYLQLVISLKPRLFIVHGKKSADHMIDLFITNGLINEGTEYLDMSIDEMEKRSPLFEFTYDNGKPGTIMACRHFMYYGSTGESFRPFREKVISMMKRG